MKTKTCGQGGFTLVEVMIVVGIIGMLATIAIPNFVKSREHAYKATCISNLRQIDGAIQQWSLELKKDSGQAVDYGDISSYLPDEDEKEDEERALLPSLCFSGMVKAWRQRRSSLGWWFWLSPAQASFSHWQRLPCFL